MDHGQVGAALHDLVARLYPIRRSLTGNGVRATLDVVADHVDVDVVEVPTGTPVLDWVIPDEWRLRSASIRRLDGSTVIDTTDTSLRVLGYSEPIRARVSREALLARVHTDPANPSAVPYRTSYHQRTWGFCLTEAERDGLVDAHYEVEIDADLAPGHLTYGEVVLPGATEDEVLLTTHVCHPELANDNASGIAVLATIGERLAARERRFTYRLLFLPGTMGSLAWLAANRAQVDRVTHGIVLAGLGDPGPLTYQASRAGNAAVDRAAALVLGGRGGAVLPFSPWGYDERQFNSPGFALPVGRLSRTPHGTYPQYHTSDDDLRFVTPAALASSLDALEAILEVVEGNRRWRNLAPYGEPQLGRRGLYDAIGGQREQGDLKLALLWVLNLSDGAHSLLDVAERSGLAFPVVAHAAELLRAADLLGPVEGQPGP
jgi:aminopeptidase-like protein